MPKNDLEKIAQLIRETRKAMQLSQQDLAMTSGTGIRFISDLERAKATCQWGKVFRVIQTLGIKVSFESSLISEDFRN